MMDSRAIGYICPFAGFTATVYNVQYIFVRFKWLYNTCDSIKICVDNFLQLLSR